MAHIHVGKVLNYVIHEVIVGFRDHCGVCDENIVSKSVSPVLIL